jgi:hypothetical protein
MLLPLLLVTTVATAYAAAALQLLLLLMLLPLFPILLLLLMLLLLLLVLLLLLLLLQISAKEVDGMITGIVQTTSSSSSKVLHKQPLKLIALALKNPLLYYITVCGLLFGEGGCFRDTQLPGLAWVGR